MRLSHFGRVAAVGLLGCGSPVDSSGSGGIALSVVAAEPGLTLTSGRIQVVGPTSLARGVTPGSTVTISGLEPGTYTVALEGFQGADLTAYVEISEVRVNPGRDTPVSGVLAQFPIPALSPFSPDTIKGTTFAVAFSPAPLAASYVAEVSTDSEFTSFSTTIFPGSSGNITVSEYRRHFVRVRARDAFGAPGPASAFRSISTIREGRAADPPGDRVPDSLAVPDFTETRIVVTDGTLHVRFTFVPGTFDPARTVAEVALDLDQAVGTGAVLPWATEVGTEFILALGALGATLPSNVLVLRHVGDTMFSQVPLSNPQLITETNGMATTLPLSVFSNDDGKLNFKGLTFVAGSNRDADLIPNGGAVVTVE